MEKERVSELKEAARRAYLRILDVVGEPGEMKNYREKLIDALGNREKLKRIGIEDEVLSKIESNEDKNVLTSFLFIDWSGYYEYEDVNLYSLSRFFEDRPKLSASSISEQAGFSAKYLRMILNEERPLTESAKEKLKPILHIYGWEKRKEKD